MKIIHCGGDVTLRAEGSNAAYWCERCGAVDPSQLSDDGWLTPRWDVAVALPRSETLRRLLGDGWEPFAVDDGVIYLRRLHDEQDSLR